MTLDTFYKLAAVIGNFEEEMEKIAKSDLEKALGLWQKANPGATQADMYNAILSHFGAEAGGDQGKSIFDLARSKGQGKDKFVFSTVKDLLNGSAPEVMAQRAETMKSNGTFGKPTSLPDGLKGEAAAKGLSIQQLKALQSAEATGLDAHKILAKNPGASSKPIGKVLQQTAEDPTRLRHMQKGFGDVAATEAAKTMFPHLSMEVPKAESNKIYNTLFGGRPTVANKALTKAHKEGKGVATTILNSMRNMSAIPEQIVEQFPKVKAVQQKASDTLANLLAAGKVSDSVASKIPDAAKGVMQSLNNKAIEAAKPVFAKMPELSMHTAGNLEGALNSVMKTPLGVKPWFKTLGGKAGLIGGPILAALGINSLRNRNN